VRDNDRRNSSSINPSRVAASREEIRMSERTPIMSRRDVDTLVREGPDGDGASWAACDPSEIAYGTPLVDRARDARFLNDLIEAAVAAGHAFIADTGVKLLLRAAYLQTRRQVDEALAAGADGDAIGWLDPGLFVDVAALATELARQLEHDARELGLPRT